MAQTYGTNTIPSDQITVQSGGTVAVSAAFETTLGLVGGMDTSNGSANTGTVKTVESTADADTFFGEDSELAYQASLVFNQQDSADTLYAVGVDETQVTGEDPSSGTSGQLSNAPVFDPNVQPEHTIDDQNGNTINVSYDVASETVSGTEGYVNPVNGNFKGDGNTTYLLDYSYGDYSSAITEVAKKVPRIISVLTENTSVGNTLLTEINSRDTDFEFIHGQIGAMPEADPASYSDGFDDRRLSVVASPRGYVDTANTEERRMMGATGSKEAGKTLGLSTTFEPVAGFADLRTKYTNAELGTFIDSEVYPVRQSGGIQIVKDMTTSTDVRFERVYASEIVDEVTEVSHNISQDFIGNPNTEENRISLEESHRTSYSEFVADNLLDAYTVAVKQGTNPDEVVVNIGVDVVDVMDLIDVTITVGSIIQNGGAA